MAHRNIGHLVKLVEFYSVDCDVFIHIDKKQHINEEDIQRLRTYSQVKYVSQRYEVHWGGTSVLDCELYLLRVALENSNANYFHLISGQDYPVRSLQHFLQFFESNCGREFIHYVRIPNPNWEDNTYRRLQFYYPYDYAVGQEKPKRWVREQIRMQQERGIRRPIPTEFDRLYGSSQWFSITRGAVQQLLDYTTDNPSLYQKMWMTFAPEECYVATVLVNLIGKDKITPCNHRFIRWHYENGNRPANLGREHFGYLLEREYLLARKIEYPCSEDLLGLIDKYLLKDVELKIGPTGGWIYDGYLKYKYEEAFFRLVTQLCQELGIRSAIDMGCGAGFYVMQWRRLGLPFAGYDANPFTPMLSSILLPQGDCPCGTADITEDLDIDSPFELVVCKDVLPYVPNTFLHKSVTNLARLSSHFILLSWKSDVKEPMDVMDCAALFADFENEGFIIEKYLTARTQVMLKRIDCVVLMKKGTALIN